MKKINLLNRLFSAVASFALLVNSIVYPFSVAYAQEEPTPTPTEISTETPTITPEVTPTPTNELTPTPEITPTPTEEITPTPTEITEPTPTVEATTTEQPSRGNSQPSDNSGQESSPEVTAIPTETGTIQAIIIQDVAATSIELTSLNYNSDGTASITTDKLDYAPTDVVVITGTGFAASKEYDLIISGTGDFQFGAKVKSDESGALFYSYQLDGNYRPNYKVEILSGNTVVATTTFTDAIGMDLSQCGNGAPGSPVICTGSAWQHGDLNENNSHYRENDSVPYRFELSGISTSESHSITIEWDTTKGGRHAIDYLTTYNRTETTADVCSGIAGCGSLSSFPIPTDTNVTGAGITPIAGDFTLFNGTITSVSPYTLSGPYTDNSSTRITINFTASNATPTLAVGGHIASQEDWGIGNSASGISGSSYHMRLIDIDGSGGHKDRSLKAAAILPVPGISTQASSSSINLGGSVTDTVTFSPVQIQSTNYGPVTGSVNFFLCGPASSNPNCPTGGTQVGNTVNISGGTATSGSFTPTQLAQIGNYCFRADYTPDAQAQYSPGNHTDLTNECFNVIQRPTLIVIKHVVNDNAGTLSASNFTINITGTNVSQSSFPGSEQGTTVYLDSGSYSVDENSVTGYSKSFSADCSGTIVVGQTKTCTVTNNDQTATLHVVKVITNDNGGTKVFSDFSFSVNGGGAQPFEADGQNDLTVNADTYTITEPGVAGYSTTYDNCSQVVIPNGGSATCTINNDDNAASLTLNKVLVNDNGGTAVESDWTLSASGPTPLSGPGAAGSADVVSGSGFSAGTYTLSESGGPSGYSASAWSCTGNGTQNGNQITLALGQSATCTITNDDIAPTLTLVKAVLNDNGGTKVVSDFPLFINGVSATSGVVYPLMANTLYTATETQYPGYEASYWGGDCSAGGTITLQPGDNKTCIILNDDIAPTLTLVKSVFNNYGGNNVVSDFNLYINALLVISGVSNILNAGSYTVSEGQLTGYTPSNWGSDCSAGGGVTLLPGDNKTCTITNSDTPASITLTKVVTNNNGGNAGANDFGLSVGGTPVNSGVTTQVNSNTPISINEVGLSGYSFVSITGDAKCPAVLGGTVTLDEGETVTCTITNDDQPAHLIVIKHVVNDNGGSATASDFSTTVSGVSTASPIAPGAESPGVDNTLTTVGSYDIDEGAHTGYDKSLSADCSGTIALGQIKTCIITNNDNASSLTLVKHVTNDNGGTAATTDWTLTATGPTPISGAGGATSGATFSAGIYTLSESTGPSGYSTGSWSCTGATLVGNSITLALDQSATCDITNDDIAPSLTLVKTVINNDGGDNVATDWLLSAAGPTPISGQGGATSGASFKAGIYTLSEDTGPGGYVGSAWDCKGGSQSGNSITLDVGESTTCTVANDDLPAKITLTKFVQNLYGGTASENDFGLTIGATSVNSGQALNVNSNTLYSLNEAGLTGYSFFSLTGNELCPKALGGTLTLSEGQTISCVITNQDIQPQLTVIKHVVDDNGGSAVAGDFTMNVTGTNVSSSSFAGSESGTTVTLNAGSYSVDENAFAGYTKSLGTDCSGTVVVGNHKTCTITNDDQPAKITLIKEVINEGGDATPNDFGISIDGKEVESGSTTEVDANTSHTIDEAGLAGYEFVSITGDEQCPGALGGSVTLDEGEEISCTITNKQVIKGISIEKSNDKSGGVSAGDTVTYTLVITNTGNVAIGNVIVTDSLPGGFTYVADSTSIVGAPDVEPTVSGSTLKWNIGTVATGESVTITYQAKISSDLSAGTYKNLATCEGLILREEPISCNIDDSDVSIGQTLSYGGKLTPQVLGAATELPATGSPTGLVIFAIAAVLGGIAIKLREKKGKHAKN